MRRRGRWLAILIEVAAVSLAGSGGHVVIAKDAPVPAAQPADAPKHPDLKEFLIIEQRNVFDATRKTDLKLANGTASASDSAPGSTPALVPNQSVIVLDGTVIRGDEAWALFDGASDVPKEGVKRGGTVVGYHIDDVRTDGVTLSNDKGAVHLVVGAGLTKNEDGAWTPVDNPVIEPSPESAQKAETKDPNDPAEKLRERRRKELGS